MFRTTIPMKARAKFLLDTDDEAFQRSIVTVVVHDKTLFEKPQRLTLYVF